MAYVVASYALVASVLIGYAWLLARERRRLRDELGVVEVDNQAPPGV